MGRLEMRKKYFNREALREETTLEKKKKNE
jgi:hypothetical protein